MVQIRLLFGEVFTHMCSLVTEIIMHHITVVAVAYIIHCSLLVFVGSQEIFFELKDSEINEVIYIGERDIEMRCGVTSLLHADLIIDHNGTVVATSTGNTVTYVIEEITQSDGWTFICTVDFIFPNGTRFNEQANLVLNVQTITPYCFHNGSSVGENLLQLTCYCLVNVNCLWVTSYLRVHTRDVSVGPMVTREHNNKTVSRVIILPSLIGSVELPMEGLYGGCLFGNRSSEGCYFTLCSDSPNGFSLNLPSLPSLPPWGWNASTLDTPTLATSTTADTTGRPTTSRPQNGTTPPLGTTIQTTEKPPKFNVGVVIVLSVTGVSIICFLPILLLLCIRRNSNGEKHEINPHYSVSVIPSNHDTKTESSHPAPERLTSTSSTKGLIPETTEL